MPSTDAIPAYHRLYVKLVERIRSGEYANGAMLPSEAELTAEHSVSRVTVRRALDLLVRDGLVEKEQGRGSFVAEIRGGSVRPAMSGVIANLVADGAALDVETLTWSEAQASRSVAENLILNRGSPCVLVRRLHRHKRSIVSLSSIYLPSAVGKALDKSQTGGMLILELLTLAGFEPDHMVHRLSATLANAEAGELMEVATGSPLLRMRGVVYGSEETPLLFSG